ncbi:MAG: hypothetical protein WDW38_010203 [Sanguina aurantia]
MSEFDTGSAALPPRWAHQLNIALLQTSLLKSIGEQIPAQHREHLSISQFSHGQSNPTYLLTFGPGGRTSATAPASTKFVLRKKPPGMIMVSAHAVEREYKVLTALAAVQVHGVPPFPVPRPLVLCEDVTVIGTPFYVMEFADGKIFVDPNLPSCSAARRSDIYHSMSDTLAQLHGVSVSASPALASLGQPSGYCTRQVRRWTTQYHVAIADTAALPEVLQLIEWLEGHIPAGDRSPSQPAVVHGDYRLDNLVYDPKSLTVKAVLDWELCTIGDPWADVAYNCLPYHLPPMPSLPKLEHPLPVGVPTEEEYVGWYCKARGLARPSAQAWAFYMALAMFRLTSILAGVQARARQGNASSAHAASASAISTQRALVAVALSLVADADKAAAAEAAKPQPSSRVSTPVSSSSSSGGNGGSGGSSSGGNGVTTAAGGVSSFISLTPRVLSLRAQVERFVRDEVIPQEETLTARAHSEGPLRWTIHPQMEVLKSKAKAAGLWNLWLPAYLADKLPHLLETLKAGAAGSGGGSGGSGGGGSGGGGGSESAESRSEVEQDAKVLLGGGLSNLEYAHICEAMGTSLWAPEVFNCSAPDTGNMEVLAKYGTALQQTTWLLPLLRGQIRSCFAMTEKAVASSDATNIQASILRDGRSYVVEGVKWWTSGAMDPRCRLAIFMGKTDPSAVPHKQQSMVLVPMDTPGVKIVRAMMVFGYDDAPHGHAEVHFAGVRVSAENMLLGEGRGFEIAQAGQQACTGAIAAAKVCAPNTALRVLDAAIQAHGGMGVCQDTVLANMWAGARTLRIADGPDEVHLGTLAKLELSRHRAAAAPRL